MSTVYGSTEKLYPSLPSATQPDESHIYRLKKIEEIEAFLQNEILERERLYKKFKRYTTSVRIVDHTLITATVITGGGDKLAALCTGIGIPVSIALGSITICLSIATAITRKTNTIYDAKIKKHDKICVLAQTKLDSIHDTASKAIEDGHVSPEEFQRIVQEKQRYLSLKQEI